jgi:hypothetical protein
MYKGKKYFPWLSTMAAGDANLSATDNEPSAPLEQHAEAGKRPACFPTTIHECLFVLTATMSIGTSSFLYGICTVITAPIGRDLKMSSAEITWINASSSFVPLSISLNK